MEPITNPVTGNEVHPRLAAEGLLVRELGLFASQSFKVKGNVSYDHVRRIRRP